MRSLLVNHPGMLGCLGRSFVPGNHLTFLPDTKNKTLHRAVTLEMETVTEGSHVSSLSSVPSSFHLHILFFSLLFSSSPPISFVPSPFSPHLKRLRIRRSLIMTSKLSSSQKVGTENNMADSVSPEN